jgi:peptidoglycan-associated lipoprotein
MKLIMDYKQILVAIFCLGSIALFAQPINSYKFEDMLATADDQMELGDYFNALEWYRKVYREAKSNDVALTIGYCYYKLRDFESAERYYERVLSTDEDNIFIEDRYSYGRVLRAMGKNQLARQQFELYLSLGDNEELRALAMNEITGIDATPSFPENRKISVDFLDEDINSGSGEYSPVQYNETTLYYSSFNRRKEIVQDGKEKDAIAKIFMVEKGAEGFEKPKALPQRINRKGFNMGNVCFSKDRRRMYFTRQELQSDNVVSSIIYVSYLGDEDWGAATPLPQVNGDHLALQPATGELFGDEVLFFVSDMDGGFGGLDIYYCNIEGDQVGPPVNLGEAINTNEDEITPFYYDGVLYFSTEFRPGMGGYDIFSSEWDGRNWSEPANVGFNFNSPFDDFYLSYDLSGINGYLVSNRPDEKKKNLRSETCCYDIYSFTFREIAIDLLVGVGTEDEKPLDGATVALYDLTIMDPPESQTLPEEYRFSFMLDPNRKYQIITSKEGFFPDTTEFNTYDIVADQTIRQKILLKTKPTEPVYETEIVTINEPIRLNNIYYEFDKWDILQEAEIDLRIILDLMNEYSDMVIELSSHTDSRGTTPYNEDLSQKRAESAKQWLVDRDIEEDRIVAKGYGESVILNRCVNGVRCSEEEHRYNRRTEFKIIEGPQSIEIRREVKVPNQDGGGPGN